MRRGWYGTLRQRFGSTRRRKFSTTRMAASCSMCCDNWPRTDVGKQRQQQNPKEHAPSCSFGVLLGIGTAGALPSYRGNTSTPQGPLPALTFLVTVLVARSTTETSFDGPLAEYRVLASSESAMPQGRAPTSTELKTLFVAVSMVNTWCPLPVLT